MNPAAEYEGVAADVLESTENESPPVDAFVLARCCELEPEPWTRAGAKLDEARGVIRFNPSGAIEKQHKDVAHEIAHLVLRRARVEDTEEAARYTGGALLMPRRAMMRDIPRMAWSVVKLRERYETVSELALAVRIAQLKDAVICAIDPKGRRRAWRRASPWITDPRAAAAKPSRFEFDLARRAWDAQTIVHEDSLCYATPSVDVDGDGSPIVIVVCEREQLSLRL